MSATTNLVQFVNLGEGMDAVVVQGDKIRIDISADGHVNVQTPGRVTTGRTSARARAEAPKIGSAMPDGCVYAGVSPQNGKPMYTTPKDAPLTLTFDQAAKHANELEAHGHRDWRVPSKAELNVLFAHSAAIGGFDTTGSFPAGWYWSSTLTNYTAWAQRFSDGHQYYDFKNYPSALRCVRG